ncbi:HAMP domain-containing sensor histidine kinase [Chitinophaga vietnamensis]|uniref:HAMP domain-containing sensor histidine kinase n=1 Tax=Chitinophaga vietnamensis TaxID=2593957 RepID=UPI0011783D78|nr:HAMP domain-containing sensor histidine kinase [Chitinophaga vietnamensis]
MKIRTRLTLLFSGIIAALLLVFALVIYISYARDREEQYYQTLRAQATTKANLLLDAKVSPSVLQLIYKNTASSAEEEVAIYDPGFHLLYHDAVDIDKVKETREMINDIAAKGEIRFSQRGLQVVGFRYEHRNGIYIITAAAADEAGLARLRNLAYTLVLAFGGSVVLVFLAGQFFARQALKPVSDMVDQMQEITATNLDLRLNEGNGKDEIAELAITFNRMLDSLEQSFDAQKQFVSNISHELRTPLTAMMAELEITASRERPASEYRESMHHAIEDAQRLVKLSNSLLDLAKASYDPAEINFREIRLDEVLMEARSSILQAHPSYKISVVFEEDMEDDDFISVNGNEYLLKVAFINLMENGCKFSAPPEVTVAVTWFKGYTVLRFTDHGVGISKEDLPNIFTPFYRGANKPVASGNGIGLSLVQKIIRLHKGDITVQSRPGMGAVFTVELPHI